MPRAGLTAERVIAEAAAVADEVGLDRLTLAAVAQRCGVSLPGLYKHVSGLDEVRRGISLLGVRELTSVGARAAAGVTGIDALYAISAAYRSYALAYPGRYAASVLAPAPGDEEHIEVATGALRRHRRGPEGLRPNRRGSHPRRPHVAVRLPRPGVAGGRGRLWPAGIRGRHLRPFIEALDRAFLHLGTQAVREMPGA